MAQVRVGMDLWQHGIKALAGSKNRLYRSCRPGYPLSDVSVEGIDSYIKDWAKHKITHVLCLLTDGEQLWYYGRDLLGFYRRRGFKVIKMPIPDHGSMRMEHAKRTCEQVAKALGEKGTRVLVHCSAGMGRTSMVLGCVAAYMSVCGPLRGVKGTGIPQTHSQEQLISEYRKWITGGK